MRPKSIHFLPINIFLFLTIFLFSCGDEIPIPDLINENYEGDELQIDGYYYHKFEGRSSNSFLILFFFKNGIAFSSVVDALNESQLNSAVKNKGNFNTEKASRDNWGIFEVNANSIKHVEWWYVPGGFGECSTRSWYGNILNDTTFIFDRMSTDNDGDLFDVNREFRFMQYSPKPDSTCPFIP